MTNKTIKLLIIVLFGFILFSQTVLAEGSTTTFSNMMGYDSVTGLFSAILDYLFGVVGTISVLFIVLGGIFYISSGGDENMIKRAKACWTGAAIGMALVLAAPTFLKELKDILGGGSSGGNPDSWVSEAMTIQEIALNVLKKLLGLLGVIATISLVIGGGMYLTAYGDDDRIKKGKKIIEYSIIGIVVALSAIVIIRELIDVINIGSTPPPA